MPKINKSKLLLQVCCIGCGAYVSDLLKKDFQTVLYFYNPNIFPQAEHDRRLEEAKRVAVRSGLELLAPDYGHEAWLEKVKGLEGEPERGRRCLVCYEDRLRAAAARAKQDGMAYFATTLTVSPHKDAGKIIAIGEKLAKEYKLGFLGRDFKKQDGFKKACALSRELGLYRQDYCGCEFSMNR